jgi:hypothetical protein
MAGEPRAGLSRRNVLRAFGGVAMVGLAGCSRSQADAASPTDIGGGEPGSVFQSLSFDLGDLVIGLPENHGVSRISLVEPDGTVFTSVSPDFAATTVRMAIADPEIGYTDYVHYTPGVHELVAKIRDRTERRDLSLVPDVSVERISVYREGVQSGDFGRLVLEIQNQGNAPTWVYDIAFEDAPNWTVNRPIKQLAGIPLHGDVNTDEVIVPPGQTREFVTSRPPLWFEEDGPSDCSGQEFQFKVIVATAAGDTITRTVRAVVGGSRKSATTGDRFVCDDSTIEVVNGAR